MGALSRFDEGAIDAREDGPLGEGTRTNSDLPVPVCAANRVGSCSSPSEYLSTAPEKLTGPPGGREITGKAA
jgi:hypothetical protein